MRTLANYLIAMFMFMYWVFRIVVTYMYETGREFVTTPINTGVEIALLFVSLICIILFIKRKKIGGIIYVVAYFAYFGVDAFNKIKPAIETYSLNSDVIISAFFSIIGVILAIVVLIDLLTDNLRQPAQKQTDWFYENKEYDRKLDSRVDKNNYRTGL